MAPVKVVCIGHPNAGITQLIHRLAGEPFLENGHPSHGIEFHRVTIPNSAKLLLWDLAHFNVSGAEYYYRDTKIALYAFDLSREVNNQVIDDICRAICNFRSVCPTAPILLVGTKSDMHPTQNNHKLAEIRSRVLASDQHHLFQSSIHISAKTGEGIPQLLTQLGDLTKKRDEEISLEEITEPVLARSPWEAALVKLSIALRTLPDNTETKIQSKLGVLKRTVLDPNESVDVKTRAIETFSRQCQLILEGKHPHVAAAVLTVATAAAVLILTSLIGFAVGFATGLWTGPGAFIAGFMTGSAAAIFVVAESGILSATAGTFAAHRFFKEAKSVTAIKTFATEIQRDYAPNEPH